MRAKRTVRVPTAAQLIVGASVLAFPATALAVNSDSSTPAAVPAASLHSDRPLSIGYGHKTIVHGSAPLADAGSRVELEYRPATAGRWHSVDSAVVNPHGRFSLAARFGRSGQLQVVPAPATSTGHSPNAVPAATSTAPTPTTTDSQATGLRASAIRPLIVRPKLKLTARTPTTAVVGSPARVRGRLLPGVAGRRLVLEERRGRHWIAVGHGRTRRGGAFDLRFTPTTVGNEVLHVAFAGDRLNTRADSNSEAVSGMHYAEVSWYYDAGNTACGFHATYGIASRTLPCGTKVTFSHDGRTVVATVDDRGPFVYSRLYDLNQNTAGALGMGGVETVLASV